MYVYYVGLQLLCHIVVQNFFVVVVVGSGIQEPYLINVHLK